MLARDGAIAQQDLRLHRSRQVHEIHVPAVQLAAAADSGGGATSPEFHEPKMFSICSSISAGEKSPTMTSSAFAGR